MLVFVIKVHFITYIIKENLEINHEGVISIKMEWIESKYYIWITKIYTLTILGIDQDYLEEMCDLDVADVWFWQM